jgi:hypothetical protein
MFGCTPGTSELEDEAPPTTAASGPHQLLFPSARALSKCDGWASDPLTRPAPADEDAGAVYPLPQGGEGWSPVGGTAWQGQRFDLAYGSTLLTVPDPAMRDEGTVPEQGRREPRP